MTILPSGIFRTLRNKCSFIWICRLVAEIQHFIHSYILNTETAEYLLYVWFDKWLYNYLVYFKRCQTNVNSSLSVVCWLRGRTRPPPHTHKPQHHHHHQTRKMDVSGFQSPHGAIYMDLLYIYTVYEFYINGRSMSLLYICTHIIAAKHVVISLHHSLLKHELYIAENEVECLISYNEHGDIYAYTYPPYILYLHTDSEVLLWWYDIHANQPDSK